MDIHQEKLILSKLDKVISLLERLIELEMSKRKVDFSVTNTDDINWASLDRLARKHAVKTVIKTLDELV